MAYGVNCPPNPLSPVPCPVPPHHHCSYLVPSSSRRPVLVLSFFVPFRILSHLLHRASIPPLCHHHQRPFRGVADARRLRLEAPTLDLDGHTIARTTRPTKANSSQLSCVPGTITTSRHSVKQRKAASLEYLDRHGLSETIPSFPSQELPPSAPAKSPASDHIVIHFICLDYYSRPRLEFFS